MKKKLGMLFLVPAVTLSLAACGNDDGKDKDGKVTIKNDSLSIAITCRANWWKTREGIINLSSRDRFT